jgi:hypothetical protein
MKMARVLTLALCLLVAAGQSQASWTGGGDGTSWGDVDNWSETVVPLTAGGATAAVIDAVQAATVVNVDAATADTFVDGTSGNFLAVRCGDPTRSTTLNVDWGNGYTNGGWIAGQNAQGTVTVNHTAGSLTTTLADYIGRGSQSGSTVNYNLSGGSYNYGQPRVGARTDALGDITLNISGSGVMQPIASGTRRFYTGGMSGGLSATMISGTGTLDIYDFRGDGDGGDVSIGTGGHTLFEVIGSSANVSFSLNFNTNQNNKENLTNIYRFVADAGGVSCITGNAIGDALRISAHSDLEVDLTGYAGTDDLDLFLVSKYTGGLWDSITIIDPLNRGYYHVQDGEGEWTDTGEMNVRTYLTIPEPATLVMLGLGGLLTMRRRRK